MNIRKIKSLYAEKNKKINKLNKLYFNDNNPAVSDKEYDELKKEIIYFEQKYNFLDSENSILKKVGHKPSKNFKKVLHRAPMLSLSNAFSEDDLKNFEKKVLSFLS